LFEFVTIQMPTQSESGGKNRERIGRNTRILVDLEELGTFKSRLMSSAIGK